jgi:NAD+ diphosphatase
LNRLSFLRTEHQFLSAALKHPSTRFILLNELAPLTHNPAELYFAKYNDLKKLVPSNFYDRSEEETIKEYDSRVTTPQLIFLGLDEEAAAAKSQDGTTPATAQEERAMTWKIYRGIPYFALDVTPKGNAEQEVYCKDLIGTLEGRGLEFFKARVHMTLPADQGEHHIITPNNYTHPRTKSKKMTVTKYHI